MTSKKIYSITTAEADKELNKAYQSLKKNFEFIEGIYDYWTSVGYDKNPNLSGEIVSKIHEWFEDIKNLVDKHSNSLEEPEIDKYDY